MSTKTASDVINDLFETWYSHLLRYACGQVKQRFVAEELVQEAFFDLYKALLSGQSIRFPKAWTMCVLRRKAMERRNDLHESLDSFPECSSGSNNSELDMAIDCQRLRGHLKVLSGREEEVLLLRLEALKCREIASALGISINSVNQYLARALEKLQNTLGAKDAKRQREQI